MLLFHWPRLCQHGNHNPFYAIMKISSLKATCIIVSDWCKVLRQKSHLLGIIFAIPDEQLAECWDVACSDAVDGLILLEDNQVLFQSISGPTDVAHPVGLGLILTVDIVIGSHVCTDLVDLSIR